VLICRVVDTKRVDAKRRASGGAEQVVADVSFTPLKKAKCTTDVYPMDEFIPSRLLDVHLPNKEGAKPVSAGRRVESTS
jgi:hypothetical protein